MYAAAWDDDGYFNHYQLRCDDGFHFLMPLSLVRCSAALQHTLLALKLHILLSVALQIAAPTNPVIGAKSEITWSYNATDPETMDIVLAPPGIIPSHPLSPISYQLWTDIKTSLGRLEVTFRNDIPP